MKAYRDKFYMFGFFLVSHHPLKLGMLKYFVFNDNNPLEKVYLLIMLSQLLPKTLGIYDVGFH
jgi:hypothetical protein